MFIGVFASLLSFPSSVALFICACFLPVILSPCSSYFVAALLETLTLYCCYYLVGCNNASPVVDSSTVLAIFMPIIGFSVAKKYSYVLALK